MLRRVVAVTNCANAESSIGLDIPGGTCSVCKRAPIGHSRDRIGQSARAGDGRQRYSATAIWAGIAGGGAAGGAVRDVSDAPAVVFPDKTPPIAHISIVTADTMIFRLEPPGASLIPQNWLAPNGYLTSRTTSRRCRQFLCLDFRGCDTVDANDDPAARVRDPHQHPFDRDCDPDAQLCDAAPARAPAAAQQLSAAPDAATGTRRKEIR